MLVEDARSLLAKLIYGMTSSQQSTFRTRFPMGIPDWEVQPAIDYARSIAGE